MKTHLRAALAVITALWLAVCALPVSAAEALPESPHPYENGATHVQRYTCADAPRGAARRILIPSPTNRHGSSCRSPTVPDSRSAT